MCGGAGFVGLSHSYEQGSIPACAGEPGYDGATGLINQVYPRVCGGAKRRTIRSPAMRGLSPRVRGSRSPSPPPSSL